MKKFLHTLVALLLTTALIVSAIPPSTASAKNQSKNYNYWWDWFDNYTYDREKADDYLVLVGLPNGSYVAYDDVAFLTGGKYIMVKAKPISIALGLTYQTVSDRKGKNVLTLSLGQDKNVYVRNSKTYYFYDYNNSTNRTTTQTLTSEYKQSVNSNYNSIHSATLSTLVNYQYYNTNNNSSYTNLGYCGVVVYNKYSRINNLPDIKNVTNFDGYIPDNNQGNYNDINITVKPSITKDPTYTDIKNVEATYTITQTTNRQILNLSEVLSTYTSYGLPSNGIYGSGNCDTSVTLQAYDKNGYLISEVKTNGNEFLMNFPNAVKLIITGEAKNLVLDFTPVLPKMITSNTKLPFQQISWVYSSDGYARQYFVIADYMKLSLENVTSSYTFFRKFLNTGSYSNPDYAGSYQRITAVLKSPYWELTSSNCSFNIAKGSKGINNSLVYFDNTQNVSLATDYETKLLSMITTVQKTGLNTYLPSKNWNRQLVIKLPDTTTTNYNNYIILDSTCFNLDYFYDYYFTLHEMVRFYESTQPHYGQRFETWSEGNATTLAKKTLDALSVAHTDSNGRDYIDIMYSTNFSFLTEDNKKNFEAYYLNATGTNAALVGYHFTEFLQDMYGSDIVYRILDKVYAAKIPTGSGRNNTYDKQFTNCIKSVTSQNVFQLFVEYYIP
ncbi:MAG: hypothetical protein K0R00_1889 [Herbinix sp.]|jgi:hypothetical protein|nr:hypothetical protein [Herbinix sp.]